MSADQNLRIEEDAFSVQALQAGEMKCHPSWKFYLIVYSRHIGTAPVKSDSLPSGPPGIWSMSSIRRDVKKKVLPRPEARFLFSRSSPLKFRFSGKAWPLAHAHKFLRGGWHPSHGLLEHG